MKTKLLSYREKFVVMDREALATFLCAVFITIVFWGAILFLGDSETFLLNFPLWFVISCLGGYLLSILGVIVLLKYFFVNFELSDDSLSNPEESHV